MWQNDNLFGCGALKFLDKDHGEFKSIRIHDKFRNKGYGIKVIEHLIYEAKKLNIKRLSIETGAGKFLNLLENYLKNVILSLVSPLHITKKT